MKIYNVDEDGIYIGEGLADPSPLEKNKFLIPARAYTNSPPTAGENQVARRVGNSWELVDDYRGEWYDADNEKVFITDVGIVPEEGWTAEPKVVEESPVPQVVSMRQARLALLAQGLLHMVDPAIASLPSPQKEAAEIEWEYSQEVQRTKPLVAVLGVMLGLNSTQLDDLFVLAKTL
jgi:hypothetical protein